MIYVMENLEVWQRAAVPPTLTEKRAMKKKEIKKEKFLSGVKFRYLGAKNV